MHYIIPSLNLCLAFVKSTNHTNYTCKRRVMGKETSQVEPVTQKNLGEQVTMDVYIIPRPYVRICPKSEKP